MKKIFLILAALIIFSSSCFAMTFSQPVKIGVVSDYGIVGGGYEFNNAVNNSGILYDWQNRKCYKNGVATFGNGNDLIYFHYNNDKKIRSYGGKSLKNTFELTQAYGCEFTQIKTNEGITFYMVQENDFDIIGKKYVLLGRKKDGNFIKYFDTASISKKYFGKEFSRDFYYENCLYDKDTVRIQFQLRNGTNGEFRFKWDEKAQWFGIEQVVYGFVKKFFIR